MVLVKFAQNILMQNLDILLKVRTLDLINLKFSLYSTNQMYSQYALRRKPILSISNAFESTGLFYFFIKLMTLHSPVFSNGRYCLCLVGPLVLQHCPIECFCNHQNRYSSTAGAKCRLHRNG